MIVVTVAMPAAANDDVDSYKFDIGVSIGMSGYLGDANESNLFRHPGLSANAGMRYLFDNRWALKGQLGLSTLSGNTADFSNALPQGHRYSFSSTVTDLSLRAECNFFAYGTGRSYLNLKRWTPYITLGAGATISSSSGANHVAFSLPMGVGVRFRIAPRLNLNAEFSMTKVFGDKVDGDRLTDLYMIKSSFLKNTDWYSGLTVGISYEFGARCETCNRID